ncbi:MAG: nitrous oxide reductase family maturation protein NosD [Promethearchaeota archaeon]
MKININAIFLLSITFVLITANSTGNLEHINLSRPVSIPVTDSHSPVFIDGNDALATFIEEKGLEGEGTIDSPYIIENFVIEAITAHGILIQSTDAYLTIRYCTIDSGSTNFKDGINLKDTSNIKIHNNLISNNKYGVYLVSSSNITISGNIVTNNSWHGIALEFSSNNIISGNNASNNDAGIRLFTLSSNNTLLGNTVSYNDEGIVLRYFSGSNVLSNNTITNNKDFGISLYTSSNNNVSWNRFLGNNRGGTSQAHDNNPDLNNTFRYNYWDDWITPDANDDGFVDVPYFIDGTAGNQDQFPLSAPHSITTIPGNIISGLIILTIILGIFIVLRHKQKRE